ncbi:MAG: membrane protein insertion efficiency factor YidD [Clostridiales bacterium]|nr:membrane protein insertion efficiency factor YidD [Clostridiales bacterium]
MIKKSFICAIRFYQKYISPTVAPRCKYYPTCSEYAVQVISSHGALKGTFLAFWRILRCNPFSNGGYDPPPLRK